jgi:uncharacterized membrane protein
MASYRQRLAQDLDGWIGRGLVPAENRAAILETVGEARRLDAATALGIIGGLLAGVAVIALVAANWSDIPRIARFGLILAAFATVCGGAAWAGGRARSVASQVLLCVAALVFAAAIGLTGQIFDIAGEPETALRAAALAAGLLAVAGGSPWTAALGLVFVLLGEATGLRFFDRSPWPWWLGVGAILGSGLAFRWRSQSLAHAAGVVSWLALGALYGKIDDRSDGLTIGMAIVATALAVGARQTRERFASAAGTLYGWWAWSALWCLAAAFGKIFSLTNLDQRESGVPFSVVMLLLSGAVVALGRVDRHGGVTAVGVFGLLASGGFLLMSLGVGLLTSAAVFGASALVALVASLLLRRRKPA